MRSWVVNKKVFAAGLIVYIVVVAATGFLLFAKQSPVAWEEGEALVGTYYGITSDGLTLPAISQRVKPYQKEGAPFIEGYKKYIPSTRGGPYKWYDNKYAASVNDNISVYTIAFIGVSLAYFGVLWKAVGARSG